MASFLVVDIGVEERVVDTEVGTEEVSFLLSSYTLRWPFGIRWS